MDFFSPFISWPQWCIASLRCLPRLTCCSWRWLIALERSRLFSKEKILQNFYIKPERILTSCQISFISCENFVPSLICHSALLCTSQFCFAGSEKQPQDFCWSSRDLTPPLRFPTPAPKTNSLFVPNSLSRCVHMIKLIRGAFKTCLFFLKNIKYLPATLSFLTSFTAKCANPLLRFKTPLIYFFSPQR